MVSDPGDIDKGSSSPLRDIKDKNRRFFGEVKPKFINIRRGLQNPLNINGKNSLIG